MTNFEKIKQMSIDEMAILFDDCEDKLLTICCDERYCKHYKKEKFYCDCSYEQCASDGRCITAMKNFLESEVI